MITYLVRRGRVNKALRNNGWFAVQHEHVIPKNMNRIYSNLAADPEFQVILKIFISEIPVRIENLRSAFERGDRCELQRLIHQLKGACGGYGFPTISEQAHDLESLVLDIEYSHLRDLIDHFTATLSCLRADVD